MMLPSLLAALALGQFGDDLVVVRAENSAKGKMELWAHLPATPHTTVPTAYASDESFHKAGGKRPVRFVFGADVDGDTVDEVVVLKEELDRGGRYRLYVHRAPKKLGHDVGKVLASTRKDALGSSTLFGEITAVAAVDVNGDGVDELAMIREVGDGTQRLELRKLPAGKKKKIGEPLGSYLDIGVAFFDGVISLDGMDIDGDAFEEIALVRGPVGQRRLDVVRPPFGVDDFLSEPLASAPVYPTTRSVRSIDLDSNGIDEIGLVRDHAPGDVRLSIHEQPHFGVLTLPVAELSFGALESDASVHSIFPLRGDATKAPPNPFEDGELSGKFTVQMQHLEVTGYTGGATVTLGPTTGTATLEYPYFDIEVGGATPLSGPFHAGQMIIGFPPVPFERPGKDGDTLSLIFQPGQVHWDGKKVIVTGSYSGSGATSNGIPFSVLSGKYSFVRQVD